MTLSQANADMPYLMTDYHLLIQPEGDKGDSGIGTGPYVLKNVEPGVRVASERNPHYFKPDRAWFDSVEFWWLTIRPRGSPSSNPARPI
jgi:peptide/nickel transport system substrate-binding protein